MRMEGAEFTQYTLVLLLLGFWIGYVVRDQT